MLYTLQTSLGTLSLLYCLGDEGTFEEIWEQMTDEEKISRIDDLQKRIFLNIKTKGKNIP